jgi:general secretion pathway protein D
VVRSPIFDITRAQTTVSARSGQTVILGGLITKNQTETTRRVPYLADIPVLGRLFRFDSTIMDRRELLIIMTPYLMKSDEQQSWLNMRESERMNWCLADVYSIHGDAERFTSAGACNPENTSPLIFPDDNPAALGPAPAPAPGGNQPELLPLDPAGGVELPPTPNMPLPPKPGLLPRPTSAPLAPQQIQAAAPMGPLGPGPSPAVYQQPLLPPGAQAPQGVAPASFQPTPAGQPPFSFQPTGPQSPPASPVYPPFPPPAQQAAVGQQPLAAQTRAGESPAVSGVRPSAQFSPPPPPALYGGQQAAP